MWTTSNSGGNSLHLVATQIKILNKFMFLGYIFSAAFAIWFYEPKYLLFSWLQIHLRAIDSLNSGISLLPRFLWHLLLVCALHLSHFVFLNSFIYFHLLFLWCNGAASHLVYSALFMATHFFDCLSRYLVYARDSFN